MVAMTAVSAKNGADQRQAASEAADKQTQMLEKQSSDRAQAEIDSANSANQALAADKQKRRANVLATGGSSDALGTAQSAIAAPSKTTVLGGGGA